MRKTVSNNSEKSYGDHRELVDANLTPAGLHQESKDEELELLNNTLTESYYNLAGGPEEFKKISSWMLANPNVEEVQVHAKPIPGGFSFIIQEVRFARVIRRYEAENSLQKRELGDKEIHSIIEHGRHIRLIANDEDGEVRYGYTVGNCAHDIPIPELIAFYPGSKTCGYVLDQLSHLFDYELIKPLSLNEVREVVGVLGDQGQVPIRLRLLAGEERQSVCENYITSIPRDEMYPLVLVDIPDTAGYYGWEQESIPACRDAYPQELAKSTATSFQRLPPRREEYPVSADAGYLCLRFHKEWARDIAEEKGEKLSWGTWLTLCNMEMWSDPSTWLEDEDQLIEDAFNLLIECSYQRGARQWVIEQLEAENDPHDIAFEWWLPRPEGPPENPELDEIGFEEHFSSQSELLSDIDWIVVSSVVKHALTDCTVKEKVAQLRSIYKKDSDSGD